MILQLAWKKKDRGEWSEVLFIINNLNCFLENLCRVLNIVEFELHEVAGRRLGRLGYGVL